MKELKQSLENLLKLNKAIEDHLQKEQESAKVEPLQTLGGVVQTPSL